MHPLRIAFMGSPELAATCLETLLATDGVDLRLVVTQPDKPAGRGRHLTPPAVKLVAERAGVPVLQPPSLRKPPFADVLRPLDLDLVVVVAYGKILPPELLAVPRLGCWNVHGSLLPRYRGAAPIQRAILDGERVTGVTLMQMEAGLDTGPMLLQREAPIADDDTSGSLHDKLALVGAALLREGIELLARGALVAVPQDDTRATLAPMLDKEQGRIDFHRPAAAVRDHIRGVDPWPGAYTFLDGEVLKLWRAEVVGDAGAGTSAAAGTVLRVSPKGIEVACLDAAVRIAEGQLPGKKRMPFAALAAGRGIAPGLRLGAATDGAPEANATVDAPGTPGPRR